VILLCNCRACGQPLALPLPDATPEAEASHASATVVFGGVRGMEGEQQKRVRSLLSTCSLAGYAQVLKPR
jgi:hypothetical protein